MPKIRVLVVDDSVVIRRMLTDILNADPDIEVAGTAPNGRIALAKLPQLNPDVVTLDIEMPELDGLGTLPELRKTFPKLPVVMFSTLTERGAVATLDALSRGASDYVAKPANVGSVQAGMQSVRELLIPKIKSLCRQSAPLAASDCVAPPRTGKPSVAIARPTACEGVVIGCSTGGPQALAGVLGALPATFPVGITVVQHMPPIFTRHLAARLNQECALSVSEANDGDVVEPGRVLIAPGDYHMELRRHCTSVRTTIQQGPPENSCRPAVDVLFRSAAAVYGSGCLAVVLTGMGQDGLRGAQLLAERGAVIIAQDQTTSIVWGMPRAVSEAGLAAKVLPLKSIADELVRLTSAGRRTAICV